MPKLKLWGRVNSINVMKALWCLDELGLDYQRVDAGMEHGVVTGDDYLARNPNAQVPTLEDGSLVLWESNAIVRHLARRYGEGTLYPDTPEDCAIADQWMDWQQTTLHADITFIFWGLVRGRKENQDPALIAAASARLAKLWAMVDGALAGRGFIAGNRLTMGDIPVGAAAWRYYNLAIERPALANVEAWLERLKAREPYRQRVMLPLT